MQTTALLYVGNLSFHTTEEQGTPVDSSRSVCRALLTCWFLRHTVYEHFGRCGEIKRVIMGRNKLTQQQCGFCFVEYFNHDNAYDARRFLNATKLDDRVIRIDLDWGFTEGRQYGRGQSGGQVRDEYRPDYDPARGGWNVRLKSVDGQPATDAMDP